MPIEPTSARWARALPWLLLLSVAILWAARWPTFPLLLDPAYHLSVALQMRDAGGLLAYEWWEAAPIGRVHLYPPAVHVLLSGLLGAGLSPITALRALSVTLMPALLASIWAVTRRLTTDDAALGALIAAIMPLSWFLYLTGTLASGLALIELLWLLAACRERRPVAGACLMALLWYTHLGVPWIAASTLAMIAVFDAAVRRTILWSLGIGTLLTTPWLLHLARHASVLRVLARAENQAIDVAPALVLLALAGIWVSWRAGGAARWMIGLWAACSLMIGAFRFRWLSAEGVLPIALLAGAALDRFASRLARAPGTRPWALLGLGGLLALGPTWRVTDAGARWIWPDAAPWHLVNRERMTPSPLDLQLYGPQAERLVQAVRRVTSSGTILWCNAPYAGGLIAALARRPTSTAMLYEVPASAAFDPVGAAQVVLWMKIDPLPGSPALEPLIRRYGLVLIADEEVGTLFRNPAAPTPARSPAAVVPLWLGSVILWGLVGLVAVDFVNMRSEKDLVWQS